MTSKTKPMSTYNLTHPLIPRQSTPKGRVSQRAESPEGQSTPKGRVPQREECPEGQSAPKGRVLKACKAEISTTTTTTKPITRFRDDE